MIIIDPNTYDNFRAKVIYKKRLSDTVTFYHVHISKIMRTIAVIQYDDSTQFTQWDWTDPVVLPENIATSKWVHTSGREAIMLDGLPRILI